MKLLRRSRRQLPDIDFGTAFLGLGFVLGVFAGFLLAIGAALSKLPAVPN